MFVPGFLLFNYHIMYSFIEFITVLHQPEIENVCSFLRKWEKYIVISTLFSRGKRTTNTKTALSFLLHKQYLSCIYSISLNKSCGKVLCWIWCEKMNCSVAWMNQFERTKAGKILLLKKKMLTKFCIFYQTVNFKTTKDIYASWNDMNVSIS